MGEFEGVNGRLRDRLVEAARAQQILYYSELDDLLKLDMGNPNDRKKMGEHLGAVSRFEIAEGRPMLSSVVWYRDMSSPGPGLFKLAVELGRVAADADELEFVLAELKRTHEYWASH